MKISTRGRYALRVTVDLAEHYCGKYIPLKDVVKRQEVSQKYLENITATLSAAGVIEGLHGKGGGYKLTRPPEEITVADVLKAVEGDFATVPCVGENAKPCPRSGGCRTISVWQGLYRVVSEYFNGITLADLIKKEDGFNDYVI